MEEYRKTIQQFLELTLLPASEEHVQIAKELAKQILDKLTDQEIARLYLSYWEYGNKKLRDYNA